MFGEFFVIYWGIVAVALSVWVYHTWAQSRHGSCGSDSDELRYAHSTVSLAFVDHGNRRELSQNMWNFFAVVALGKAQMPGRQPVSCLAVGICNLLLGALQMFTIFLLVHDIDPNADPITDTPSTPWKRTTWSVNCMKWIQVAFMAAAVSSEVSQAMQLFKVFLMLMAAGQYVVTLWVLFGGVAVVLSFQAVPDILYSSMAIVFVNSIDDLMYQFVESVFDIDADFRLPESPALDPSHEWLQEWLPVMSRVVAVFPLAFALFLMGESWYYNIMPNAWIRHVIKQW
ncbi:unnamed protein product [Prorocentrum cordatum]|uniref:Uncharacterized protein n=1 Tax=Prorocentrum cordatum TaxID=2364126 RepID=A0ABN9YA54_9DINO|nr:unnamed protein product [Polarella glacialis]